VNKREVTSKREIANKREIAQRREIANKREAIKRELASRRENTSRRETTRAMPPLLRKTVIVSSPQLNNQKAARESLVNDIVIISLAEETPVTGRLPITSKSTIAGGSNTPSIWPVAGTSARSGFGVRRNPFGGRSTEFHKGQDISAPMGTPVIATADGTVTIAGWQRGYGQVVYVDHGNGLSTRYGHLSRIDVLEGQTVTRGQLLGRVGSTGRSTGPHLHYEVRVDGQPTNPMRYLPQLQITPAPVIQSAPGIQ
jgi:murein DD-endopeptidase MepM/ murein hydrolase activator NlpD